MELEVEPRVIFEDSDILVLDKPSGMIVNRSDTTKGERTVQEWVEEYLQIRSTKSEMQNKLKIQNSNVQNNFEFRDSNFEFLNRAGIVHRLDKETSGILLVAKNPGVFKNLQAQFKERKVKKTYIALTHGKIEPMEGEINVSVSRLPWNRKRFGVVPEGRESITRYRIISNFQQDLTLLELYPKTGRTHQIRVHLQYIHHPVFSDPLYAGRKTSRNDRKLLPRIFLHASEISFFGPKTQELLSFESPLPEDLSKFLEALK